MVQMQMGIQQMFHIQPIIDDEAFQGLLFFFIKTARVNDDRFIGFVPKHITILREHIKFESLLFFILCILDFLKPSTFSALNLHFYDAHPLL